MFSKKGLIIIFFCLEIAYAATFAGNGPNGTHYIVIPDIPGYYTLKCDFHTHTIFSDGLVWPTIRVDEALKCGLDAIAITDHIEHQPYIQDVNPGHNRSNEIASAYAENKGLVVIPGAEITREMPPGHFNAIFIKDADKLALNDVMDVFREAKAQGAFVFWNHPAWQPQCQNGIAQLSDMHKDLIKKGYIQGIEIVNGVTDNYSDESFHFALKYNLAPMCNSDIHGLGEWEWNQSGHRPVTLVFAKEKTAESIREALIAGRTTAYYENYIIGKAEFLNALFLSSLNINAYYPIDQAIATIRIKNNSDVDYLCENKSKYTFQSDPYFFIIPAQSTRTILVKTGDRLQSFNVELLVHNLVSSPGKGTEVNLHVQLPG